MTQVKKWILKAIVQKTISFLPFSRDINYFFQKYVTKGVYLTDEYFYDRLEHARAHLDAFRKYSNRPLPSSILEIGTGWYPIVPVSFFLAGTEKIYSVDISFLISKQRLHTTLRRLAECHQADLLKNHIQVLPERVSVMMDLLEQYDQLSLEEILNQLQIHYLVEDATRLSLPDQSIDLVNSNNTFEHIYPDTLVSILQQFKRVIRKDGGVMSHFIDMSDHFAHFDRSINIYNFLRFTDRQWKWIDNSIQPQNRLRIYDYKQIYSDLDISIDGESSRAGDPAALSTIPLAPEFSGQPLEEVAISHCHFISGMCNK